jgi:4-hydroxy-tetrahydrodipicolinate reductase
MGQRIDRLCANSSGRVEVVGRFDRSGLQDTCPSGTDVIIDFSSSEGTQGAIRCARGTKAALLVGTTGLTATTVGLLRDASVEIPVLLSPNTSLGVAVMRHLATEAARLLGDGFTLSIREVHHTRKLDKPSGTALALADAAARGGHSIDSAQIESIREGDVVGDHALVWEGAAERIVLRHEAKDRDLFAQGAIEMARWICRQNAGFYGIDDWFASWKDSRP